jgi:zona occludens toxin (predicted ATPase)
VFRGPIRLNPYLPVSMTARRRAAALQPNSLLTSAATPGQIESSGFRVSRSGFQKDRIRVHPRYPRRIRIPFPRFLRISAH